MGHRVARVGVQRAVDRDAREGPVPGLPRRERQQGRGGGRIVERCTAQYVDPEPAVVLTKGGVHSCPCVVSDADITEQDSQPGEVLDAGNAAA